MCIECGSGFHDLCEATGKCSECHGGEEEIEQLDPEEAAELVDSVGMIQFPARPRTYKKNTDRQLKDPQSTGRKRAAALYKIDNTEACEWRGKANCGGGLHPIVGCIAGFQIALHHGSDKNTLNNQRSNVHKICSTCHNRWHAENDPDYDPEDFHPVHDPRDMTVEDLHQSTQRWNGINLKNAVD